MMVIIMKKTMRLLLPILLAVAILFCLIWYFFIYDRAFARDVLLSCARVSERNGNFSVSSWFYNRAYDLSDRGASGDLVAVELAEQHMRSGNYTKAEYTLTNAIREGAGIDVYIALSRVFLKQDKVYDAINMLNGVSDPTIKAKLAELRPAAPSCSPDPGAYSQYIPVSLQAESGTIYSATGGKYPSVKGKPYSDPITLVDGENTIFAVTVSDLGLVSQLAIFGFNVGGVVKEMTFADVSVEAQVRATLGVSDNKQLFTNDLWKITSFTVPADATSYADLAHMTRLTSLTVENGVSSELSYLQNLTELNELTVINTDISADTVNIIGTLTKLEKLTLRSCKISGISALASNTAITHLDLSGNAISNIEPLASMKGLIEADLSQNAIADLSPLSALSSLTKLDVSNNSVITSLAPLSGIAELTWLDAGTNSIQELGKLGNLKSLAYLNLSVNKLTDISTIGACTNITELDISDNQITDISCLSALTQMRNFNFAHNAVTALPAFPADCALVNITGEHNKLQSLDPLGGLSYLNNVNMDYNADVSSVSALAKCPRLIEVNVYGTKVSDVSMLTAQDIIVNYNPT